MRSDKKILIAFLLNLFFSIFELVGGFFTGSIAILSDSLHDFCDALSIGISYFLEKKSKRKPNNKYTYGYLRYSVIGSVLTTTILIAGSIFVIYSSILRLINPVEINYDGMMILAIIGVIINLIATHFTKDGESLNQRSVNLHMIEDVLGWIVVLIGSIIMKFSSISIIDPILSIIVAIYILIHALKNLKQILDIFLEKTPESVNIDDIKKQILKVDGVKGVHHIHVRSMDGFHNFATLHVIAEEYSEDVKKQVKGKLKELNIGHSTIELELENEECLDESCKVELENHMLHHHHH